MKRAFSFALGAGVAGAALALWFSQPTVPANAQGSVADVFGMGQSAATVAPEFPTNAQWLNTAKPLSLRALRGKIVLLDFWTYGCINCIHILPDLKKLERKYPNELVVIGVHSAKFENENNPANIRNAMLRYNIEHPVVVDKDQRIWESFGVNAWPSFVVLDAAGKPTFMTAGEGQFAALDKAIAAQIEIAKRAGKLNATPLKFALEAAQTENTDLWFPGKVLAAGNRIFIADSNHNRIVITDKNGVTEAVAGSGEAGLQDGAFDEATFRNPHGMALDGDMLYVADTENHAIRALDLKAGTVSTIAGNGKQAPWRSQGGGGTEAALSSPWDVLKFDRTLYIAMAGPHQIWSLNLDNQAVKPFAGSGREARLDGRAKEAALAQPSGLATDGDTLFFADSESSSIRGASLKTGAVRTFAGGSDNPQDLFAFGDIDGRGTKARLQHPLAVEFRDGQLFVADTYNNKIKTLDVETGEIKTFAGTSEAGRKDGPLPAARFYEPGGLSLDGERLLVADTNNQQIRVIDLKTREVSTLKLTGVPAALPAEPQRPVKPQRDDAIALPKVVLSPNANGELLFDAKLPAGYKLTEGAQQKFFARVEGKGVELAMVKTKFGLPMRLPLRTDAGGSGAVIVNSTIYYCTYANGVCKVKSLRYRIPFEVGAGGDTRIAVAPQL